MTGPQQLAVGDLPAFLPAGGHAYVSSCSAESGLLAAEVENAGDALGDRQFSGVFISGLNRKTWQAGKQSRTVTFFQTPELKAIGDRGRFLPMCYQDITRWYAANAPDAVLLMVSPPDENGMCSLGTEPGFGGDLWRNAPIRIAHINPSMPRTLGDPGIPFSQLTAVVEADQPLLTMSALPPDPVTEAIAANVAAWIPDYATLQTGLGKLPDAVLDRLHDRRGLRFHTGLIGDAGLRLALSGAFADGAAAVVGCAIGGEALYAGLGHQVFDFRPVSITHNLATLMQIERLITVNSALSVDLFGQAYAEAGPSGFLSGPGGATDFARGARASEGGLRIVALPSSAKGNSRIVSPDSATGPVSLGRFDLDIVATEHGSADLRGKDYHEKAKALIAIAAPEHREALEREWSEIARMI